VILPELGTLTTSKLPRTPPYHFMYVVQVHILDDAQGAEDGFREHLATSDGCRRIAPLPLMRRLRPLIEIGEEDSLRREPSAGHSKGELPSERRRWSS
jgi:hypothetical protein